MDTTLDNIPFIPCHSGNYGAPRQASDIRYLVYHYTGNDGDTALANASYYANTPVKASAHYFVDDDGAVRSVPDLYTAWAVGGQKWSDCARTGGGKLHGVVTNSNSLSIELCDTVRDGKLMATEATLANGVALGKALMARYGIPIGRVVRHFDVTGKHCPAYFMDAQAWEAFCARLTATEEASSPVVGRYQTVEEVRKRAPWAAATVEKLLALGALKGGGSGLSLSEDMLRTLVINDRLGLY